MKKLILMSLVLLVFNVFTVLLIIAAVGMFAFGGDRSLAAIPVVMALPGIILQPWYVLCSIPCLIICPYISSWAMMIFVPPVLTTVVTLSLYATLNRMGKLGRIKLALTKLSKRNICGFVIVL